jgi:hypothetical protein
LIWVSDLDEKTTVVDFKTSASAYVEYEVTLSDQLTAYQLAEPDVNSRLCALKLKESRIEWHNAKREGQQLIEYLTKALNTSPMKSTPATFISGRESGVGAIIYLFALEIRSRLRETLVQMR